MVANIEIHLKLRKFASTNYKRRMLIFHILILLCSVLVTTISAHHLTDLITTIYLVSMTVIGILIIALTIMNVRSITRSKFPELNR